MTISDTTAGGGTASPDLCWALAPRIRPVPGGLIRGATGVREPAARSMGRNVTFALFAPEPNPNGSAFSTGGDPPHQREHRGELAEPAPCQAAGQVAGGLGDQHDHGEVVEEFEWADHTVARLLAVRTRRLPQRAAQPGPPLTPPQTLGDS